MSVTLNAPVGFTGQINASPSGNVYSIASGQVTVDDNDAPALLRAGFTVASTTDGANPTAMLEASAVPLDDATGGTVAAPVVDSGGVNTTGV